MELAVKTYLLLESVDRWLLQQPSLVNKSRRQLFPVILQRQQLADALARYMGQLRLPGRYRASRSTSRPGTVTKAPLPLPRPSHRHSAKIINTLRVTVPHPSDPHRPSRRHTGPRRANP